MTYEARLNRLVVTGEPQLESLVPRRLLLAAGDGRWIVADRESPTEDEMQSWVDAARSWGNPESPRVLYITECVPLDERLVTPMRWTTDLRQPDSGFGPPPPLAIQRRCWTISEGSDETGVAQCWLFNGHPGEHQWGPAE